MLTLPVLGLGLFAGVTIYLGMPIARRKTTSSGARTFLGMFTAGILLFLFVDVMAGALAQVLTGATGSLPAPPAETVAIVLGGFALAFLGLTWFEQLYRVRGTQGAEETGASSLPLPPLRAMNLIAVGIGFHNFAEGLAIGASYVAGGIAAATLLFVGFAVHNSTEGFGVVGPAMGAGIVPSWRRLAALGAVAGVPTLLGTVAGSVLVAPTVGTAFLAIAGGAILYVVLELARLSGRRPDTRLRSVGLLSGFALGLLSDLLLTLAHV